MITCIETRSDHSSWLLLCLYYIHIWRWWYWVIFITPAVGWADCAMQTKMCDRKTFWKSHTEIFRYTSLIIGQLQIILTWLTLLLSDHSIPSNMVNYDQSDKVWLHLHILNGNHFVHRSTHTQPVPLNGLKSWLEVFKKSRNVQLV